MAGSPGQNVDQDAMSTAPPSSKAPPKARKEKENHKEEKRKANQPSERIKIIVRRLPPNLPEDIFWQSVQNWVTDETTSWKIYYAGKLRKKLNKENVPSRAYIAFKTDDQVAQFKRDYDGHVFRDKQGVESQAVVEFAPYPKIPTEKRKADTRNGTIEKDEDYISFLESLKAAENVEPLSLETLIAKAQPPPAPKTTPLLEALKAERTAAKDKEAILRNHAHYNQIHTRSKEDKRKAALASQAAKAAAEVPQAPTPAVGAPITRRAKKEKAAAAASSSNAKPANGQAKLAAPVSTPAGGSSQPGRPPKPPRAPKGPKNPALNGTAESATTPTTATADPSATQPAAPRRSRPIIGGSRQFEAALIGVTASALERKARREKEKETPKPADGSDGKPQAPPISATTSGSSAKADQSDVKSGPPQSPKKNKRREKAGGGGALAVASGSVTPAVKVPSILKRPQEETPNAAQKAPAPPVAASTSSGTTPSGGGGAPPPRGGPNPRRFRGRGRGGGPPNVISKAGG